VGRMTIAFSCHSSTMVNIAMECDLRRWMRLIEADQPADSEEVISADDFIEACDIALAKSKYAAISHLNLFPMGDGEVEISHIGVEAAHRQKGVGGRLMRFLTDLADYHDITLYASPATDADPDEGPGYDRLQDWYEGWGFVKLSGQDMMCREPAVD